MRKIGRFQDPVLREALGELSKRALGVCLDVVALWNNAEFYRVPGKRIGKYRACFALYAICAPILRNRLVVRALSDLVEGEGGIRSRLPFPF